MESVLRSLVFSRVENLFFEKHSSIIELDVEGEGLNSSPSPSELYARSSPHAGPLLTDTVLDVVKSNWQFALKLLQDSSFLLKHNCPRTFDVEKGTRDP